MRVFALLLLCIVCVRYVFNLNGRSGCPIQGSNAGLPWACSCRFLGGAPLVLEEYQAQEYYCLIYKLLTWGYGLDGLIDDSS